MLKLFDAFLLVSSLHNMLMLLWLKVHGEQSPTTT